jgi:hypothetical protein
MKTDWTKIKQEFIEGADIGYPALADKFKVNYVVLKRHAAKEKWTELRKLFQAKVQNLRTEKKSEIMASESVAFDSDCLNTARKILIAADKGIDTGEPVDKMASAVEKAQKIGRLAFGEATDKTEATGNVTISVSSENAKKLTEQIINGDD